VVEPDLAGKVLEYDKLALHLMKTIRAMLRDRIHVDLPELLRELAADRAFDDPATIFAALAGRQREARSAGESTSDAGRVDGPTWIVQR
jgi:hypothetical protein